MQACHDARGRWRAERGNCSLLGPGRWDVLSQLCRTQLPRLTQDREVSSEARGQAEAKQYNSRRQAHSYAEEANTILQSPARLISCPSIPSHPIPSHPIPSSRPPAQTRITTPHSHSPHPPHPACHKVAPSDGLPPLTYAGGNTLIWGPCLLLIHAVFPTASHSHCNITVSSVSTRRSPTLTATEISAAKLCTVAATSALNRPAPPNLSPGPD
ncbi:hypothetical protein IQ07DRAFT_108426 [Pyrenochaeta sp. DS3sAY3a]|nr:hypothetical protein IQ07DRAFT_108426 [Pyrenochaeta sp. DS3sAY3a]